MSVFAASAPSDFITSHLRTIAEIEEAIDIVATQLADFYVIPSIVTIGGPTLTRTHNGNVKYKKSSHELLQFGFVASWQAS
jgi:hypothetical protein